MKRALLYLWHRGWEYYHMSHINLYHAAGHIRTQSAELAYHYERFNYHVNCLLALKKDHFE